MILPVRGEFNCTHNRTEDKQKIRIIAFVLNVECSLLPENAI